MLAASGRHEQRRLTKPLLMPLLMVGRDRPTVRALTLGWIGDIALLGHSKSSFRIGLGGFLAGHLAWVAALLPRSQGKLRERPGRAVPYLGAWAVLNAFLWPRAGQDRVPVLLYSAALLSMSLVALDTGEAPVAVGGALFLVSDALLALERFGDVHLPAHEGIVMATYTSAQALLASS
jgi:uncharacterized membrane protein YhhN